MTFEEQFPRLIGLSIHTSDGKKVLFDSEDEFIQRFLLKYCLDKERVKKAIEKHKATGQSITARCVNVKFDDVLKELGL